MIRLLIELMRSAGIDYGFFRLADYPTFRALMGMATALAISMFWGHRIIVRLYHERFRDASVDILTIGDVRSKRGTPSAGGVLMLTAVCFSVAFWADLESGFIAPLLIGFLYMGFVGFIDDFQKARFKSSLSGLGQLAKTMLQMLFLVPFAIFFVSPLSPIHSDLQTLIYVPFYKRPLFDLGMLGFIAFTVFAIFSIINAVNIADGYDGLLSTTSLSTVGVYVIFAFVVGNVEIATQLLFPPIPGAEEVAVFGAILMGSVLGFLWYNAYPAEVFMGDTGSLAIGAAIGMMAFFVKQEMLFLIVGGIFVLEILTSLLQDKIGNRIGRRIVHRAPFHYTMTHRGVAETKVVMRIWIISLMLALVGLLSLKVR